MIHGASQWVKVIMLHIYDEGHVLFSTLAVMSGITQPSHDAKNYVFVRGRGFNEPCSMCFVIFTVLFQPLHLLTLVFYDYSGCLTTGTPIQTHYFSCMIASLVSRR